MLKVALNSPEYKHKDAASCSEMLFFLSCLMDLERREECVIFY